MPEPKKRGKPRPKDPDRTVHGQHVKPEIAHSILSVTLGQRLARRAPMRRVKDG